MGDGNCFPAYFVSYDNLKPNLQEEKGMKKILALAIIAAFLLFPVLASAQEPELQSTLKLQSPQNTKIGFVIHGGARVIRRGSLTPEAEKEYRAKLEEAVLAGYNALKEGKSSLDAIEAAIIIMEDCPLFNAGKGGRFYGRRKK